jgi:ubiquinone/menaquinone biosynthesis C-methylase UbiE
MVEKTREHGSLAGFDNITVLESSFDATPLEDESVDVVISNGAFNLTSCKESVFAEIYRVLKPNGKIQFADMIDTSIDEGSCCSVEGSSCCDSQEEDWANCVAGTLREDELVSIMQNAGFKDVVCHGTNHYTTSDTTKGATFSATKISSEALRESHWDEVFKTVDYTQVLWHQNLPQKSLDYIKNYAEKESAIIDAGCGASFLIDNLVEQNYRDITLLDTSKTSLDIVKQRIKSENINYIYSDILNFQSKKKFDIWHDRAVFHFLLSKKERQKYFAVLRNSLVNEGTAIISTFRVDGPIQCSGLDIVQYNHKKMLKELPEDFKLVASEEYLHITPSKSEQEYIYFVIRKVFKPAMESKLL